jgi:hypothetical protein
MSYCKTLALSVIFLPRLGASFFMRASSVIANTSSLELARSSSLVTGSTWNELVEQKARCEVV